MFPSSRRYLGGKGEKKRERDSILTFMRVWRVKILTFPQNLLSLHQFLYLLLNLKLLSPITECVATQSVFPTYMGEISHLPAAHQLPMCSMCCTRHTPTAARSLKSWSAPCAMHNYTKYLRVQRRCSDSAQKLPFPKYLKCYINRKSIRYQEIPEPLAQRKPRLKDTIYISQGKGLPQGIP